MFHHDKINIGYKDLDATTTDTGRAYTLPNGSSYPSVTTVLSILTEDAIRSWRNRVGEEQADIVSGKASMEISLPRIEANPKIITKK